MKQSGNVGFNTKVDILRQNNIYYHYGFHMITKKNSKSYDDDICCNRSNFNFTFSLPYSRAIYNPIHIIYDSFGVNPSFFAKSRAAGGAFCNNGADFSAAAALSFTARSAATRLPDSI